MYAHRREMLLHAETRGEKVLSQMQSMHLKASADT